MEPAVNFENLHAVTDGDPALEAALFASFLDAASTCLGGLRRAQACRDENAWRQQAHALKGVSLNLGAVLLGELCEQAQLDWRAAPEDKQVALILIEAEYARVGAAVRGAIKP